MSDGSYFFDSRISKGNPTDYVKDKEISCKSFMNYTSIRLQQMFHYENLPESIPREMLEYYLINNGTCFITEVDGNLYSLLGSYGGKQDAYYRPTRYIVANPGLNLSKDYDLVNDGVLMRNDSLWLGLYPLLSRYGVLLSENLLTLRTADILLRIMALFTAPDDNSKIAAEEYLRKLEKGDLGVIGEDRLFGEGVKMQSPPSNNGSYLTQFIELHQYLLGSMYNELGLNANFNMKREALGDGETSLNEDSLMPLCEEMLRCRQEDWDKVNAMFGCNVKVSFSSSWLRNEKEMLFGLQKLANEASQLAESVDCDERGRNGIDAESTSGSFNDDESDTENGSTDASNSNESNGPASIDVDTEGSSGSEEGTENPSSRESEHDNGLANPNNVNIEINVNISEEEGENVDRISKES